MRILTRYVLREFCVPLGYCLTGFLSIYILFELFTSFGRLVEAHPPWYIVVEYFAGYLAPYFEWMAPACLMLATLYTMWSFCRHSELIAMRASGVGFFAIVKPLLVVSVLMAAFVYWVNEVYVPDRGQWAKSFRSARFKESEMSQADNILYRNSVERRTWSIGAAMNADATALEDVTVNVDYPGGGRRMSVKSDRVDYMDGQWWFARPTVYYFDADGHEMPSPVPELDKLTLRVFPNFDEQPRDFVLQNRSWEFNSISDRRRYIEIHPTIDPSTRTGYEYDIWSQFTAPLACIVITLFAIPAGIATGRQSVFKGIVGALAMFFAFYALTIGCMVLAKQEILPPLPASLIPDVVFFAIGCVMFWRNR